MYKCCNMSDLHEARVVILGIRFPATICMTCGELVDDVQNPIQKVLLKVLNPFWDGKVLVDTEIAEKEKYR